MWPLTVLATLTASLVVLGGVPADAQPTPYHDPPFTCEVEHVYGEGEAPELTDLPDDDPLCVVYAKEEITVADGGAVAFLLGEPARVAAALPACRYWQRDTWSIQLAADTQTVVRWDGRYWYDRGAGTGAASMRGLELGGQPASPTEVADALEPLSADLADVFRSYGEETGGGGVAFDLGDGDPSCPATEPAPDPPADPDDAQDPPASATDEAASDPGPPGAAEPRPRDVRSSDATGQLPATGGAPSVLAALLLLTALALRTR